MPDPAPYRTRCHHDELVAWLRAQRGQAVTLTFDTVESLLHRSLPGPAYSGCACWMTPRPTAANRHWRATGWEVRAVDRWERTVTFGRIARKAPA
jgi:hypothetical protein